ncbi:hypothetical protein [Nocardioides sp. zg-DK7169]|uniref:hypothetical protein n=1 Tax=Nocardioides sp. zg-DK7169 TaxID=2736600 RepID=UPI00155565C4|nr:hypothetical protein [Nocardioides sp. zg-DK7169]NPC95225.1 hypothetical protein [Nocardioides sp. zg-DK7169]
MSRIDAVAHRYEAAASLMQQGVSIFAVGDPAGAQLNAAIRRTLFALGDERSEVWNGVLQAANALRWRRMTQPQPSEFQTNQALVDDIVRQAKRLRNLVSDGALLDLIADAAVAVGATDSPTGAVLLESVQEVGPDGCVVVASKGSARAGLASWLDEVGATVLIPSELDAVRSTVEVSYVIAPPTFMPSSVVTAPVTPEVTFVMPAWFGNRSVPSSTLGVHAEGQIVVRTTVHQIGDTAEPENAVAEDEDVTDVYFPQPDWGARTSGDREPTSDEVEAWKVLLVGGQGLWLDDGDRIRSLDPKQPEGARVGYEAVKSIVPGTYLVLREGETERGAMYDQAVIALGARATGILATQARWKARLEERLARVGSRRAISELERVGVRSCGQVRAWADPRLICPQRDADFALLLDWLGEPAQPTYGNAITLRRAVYKASADLRKELEAAVGRADLRVLERDGILHLDLPRDGFRGMIVVRVLAKAPFTEIVSRHQVRVPFTEGSAQWLD